MIDAHTLRALIEAIGIGLLIGFEREKDRQAGTPAGLRTFLFFSLLGVFSAISGSIPLAVVTMASVAALLVVGTLQRREPEQAGLTTAAGGLVTFWLGYLTWTQEAPAIMLAIVTATALAAKRRLHDFATKTLSEAEFYDTLKFLAIIFIIYPIIPDRAYGPGGVISPRQVWLFVILVSSISYVGYFLTKFLGAERGVLLTAIVGGLASTTASTVAFAREAREDTSGDRTYAVAAVAANTVQFPRLWAILYAINPSMAADALWPLAAATAAGGALVLAFLRFRGTRTGTGFQAVRVDNPFSIRPALVFGLYFTAILVVTRVAIDRLGAEGVYFTSLLGGTFDVDAIAISLSRLASQAGIERDAAVLALVFAATGNAIVKLVVGAWIGGRQFAARLALGFLAIFAAAFGAVGIIGT